MQRLRMKLVMIIRYRMRFLQPLDAEVGVEAGGGVRAAAAQQPDQLPPEPEIPAVDPAAFATGMVGINQGLAALNQAMPLVQQMLQ